MSNHTIILPEETYKVLLEVAREQGLTPENWIAAQLSRELVLPNATPMPEPLLSELTADLIGVIDSQAEPHYQSQETHFGEQLAKKFSKQKIRNTAVKPSFL
ncbi:MAG: hypothetical protein F6K17_26610 [Okeania sp. SIO3C4]|nr:hypothetical protein [Okeania sp. SIO3B3]NER05904.1 hypothetical protein [Okeania sp. SIO3C4]